VFLERASAALPPGARPLFAFDFDKTLTNGFAPPGAPLAARVRGGRRTLDGLRAAAAAARRGGGGGRAAALRVLTARADEAGRVGEGTLAKVHAQLRAAQVRAPFIQPFAHSALEWGVEQTPPPPRRDGSTRMSRRARAVSPAQRVPYQISEAIRRRKRVRWCAVVVSRVIQ